MKNKLAGGLLILLISLPFAMSANSQERRTGERAFNRGMDLTEQRIDNLKEQLSLTDDQVAQLKQLQEERRQSRKEMNAERFEKAEARRAEASKRRSELAEARLADRKAFEAVLTPEQIEKLAETRQLAQVRDRRARVAKQRAFRQGRAARTGRYDRPNRQARFAAPKARTQRSRRANFRNASGQRAFARLDLADDQKAKLTELRQNIKLQGEEWHQSNPEASFDETQEFRNSQRDALQSGLKSILSDEQLEKLNDHRRRGAKRGGGRGLR